jgi:MYXO-CTERM domain-containing protein
MRYSFVRLLAVLLMGLLAGVNGARAEYMNWSYYWSISPAPVLASGTGTVSQALGKGGNGSTRLLAAAVTTNSDTSARTPDRFHSYFNLTLHLTDRATHQSGSLTFRGLISGTLTANSAHLTETFLTPAEHLTLGKHIYWVELPKSISLLPPGSPVVPYYYAEVQVENVPTLSHPAVKAASMMIQTASVATDPAPASAPEPSGLVLGGLGVVLLGGAGIRRYRRRALAAAA